MTYLRIARIVNTYGIKGTVKVIADTDFPQNRFKKGTPLWILGEAGPALQVTVASSQAHKGTYLIDFEEYDSINQVEGFKNSWLAIQPHQQDALPEDSFYYHEIIGLQVYTEEGDLLGPVVDILELGSNDVWVVDRGRPQKKDLLLPFISDIVKSVDLDQGRVTIDLIEGLDPDEN